MIRVEALTRTYGDLTAVDRISFEIGTDSAALKKQAGQWRLPKSGDSPVNSSGVEPLLHPLAVLERVWPVAKTRGAARRFKVDEEQFERKLILL